LSKSASRMPSSHIFSTTLVHRNGHKARIIQAHLVCPVHLLPLPQNKVGLISLLSQSIRKIGVKLVKCAIGQNTHLEVVFLRAAEAARSEEHPFHFDAPHPYFSFKIPNWTAKLCSPWHHLVVFSTRFNPLQGLVCRVPTDSMTFHPAPYSVTHFPCQFDAHARQTPASGQERCDAIPAIHYRLAFRLICKAVNVTIQRFCLPVILWESLLPLADLQCKPFSF